MWIKKPDNAQGAELINLSLYRSIFKEDVKRYKSEERTPMFTFCLKYGEGESWAFKTHEERDEALDDLAKLLSAADLDAVDSGDDCDARTPDGEVLVIHNRTTKEFYEIDMNEEPRDTTVDKVKAAFRVPERNLVMVRRISEDSPENYGVWRFEPWEKEKEMKK